MICHFREMLQKKSLLPVRTQRLLEKETKNSKLRGTTLFQNPLTMILLLAVTFMTCRYYGRLPSAPTVVSGSCSRTSSPSILLRSYTSRPLSARSQENYCFPSLHLLFENIPDVCTLVNPELRGYSPGTSAAFPSGLSFLSRCSLRSPSSDGTGAFTSIPRGSTGVENTICVLVRPNF